VVIAPDDLAFPQPVTEDGQPATILRELSYHKPLLSVISPGGGHVWLVSGNELVREVLSDAARFTSMFDPAFADNRADMVLLDPPEHTRIRKLAARAFTVRRIQALMPEIEQLLASLLTSMEQAGPPADLVPALASPFPAAVICSVLGIPDEDRLRMRRWVSAFTSVAPAASGEGSSENDTADALDDMHTYVRRLVADRFKQQGEDVLSALIEARSGDDRLSEEELLATTMLMIVAGQETTAKAITRGVMVLAGSSQWSRLAAGEMIAEHVVEEILRHQSPIDTAIFRRAKMETELGGVPIKAGDQLFVSLHLANFDPDARSDPQLFDPGRTDQGHVSFGHGPHFCLGAGLARAELAAVFHTLPARFPDLRLDLPLGKLHWSTGSVVNAPTSLPVRW